MLSYHPVLDEWKRRAQEYERIIAAFEKMGNDMRRRRIGALDSVMELLDARGHQGKPALRCVDAVKFRVRGRTA